MGKFADRSIVPVQIEGDPHVIYIRARMDIGTRNALQDALMSGKLSDAGMDVRVTMGAQKTELLIHNIVRWEGPEFQGIPVTPANIRTLDPDDLLVKEVLEEIGRRNAPKPSPKAVSAGATTSTSDTNTTLDFPETNANVLVITT